MEMKKDKTEGEESGGGGFGGFGATESKPPPSTTTGRDRSFSNVSVLSGGRPKSHQSIKVADQSTHEAILENVEESPSALEMQLTRREQIRH